MSSRHPFSQSVFKNCLVVIPIWNESASIKTVVQSIKEKYTVDILVVDDGSTDNSGDLAEDAGAEVVRLAMNMGAWTAIQTGFRYALLKGYTVVVTMDGDGQHFAESIPLLIKQLTKNQADVIIGSNPDRASRNRRMSWAFFRMLTSFDLQDFTSGLKAYNDRAMTLLLRPRAHLFDYQDMGTLLLIRRAGLTICEVPVPMQKRLYGSSRIFFNWWQVIRYMMLSTVLCISKYRH